MDLHLVQGENGLTGHVLEQQLRGFPMSLTTGMVQRRVAGLSTEGNKNSNEKLPCLKKSAVQRDNLVHSIADRILHDSNLASLINVDACGYQNLESVLQTKFTRMHGK